MGMKALSAMRAAKQVAADNASHSKIVAKSVVTRPKLIGQFISMSALPSVRPAVQQALQKSAVPLGFVRETAEVRALSMLGRTLELNKAQCCLSSLQNKAQLAVSQSKLRAVWEQVGKDDLQLLLVALDAFVIDVPGARSKSLCYRWLCATQARNTTRLMDVLMSY